MFLGKSLKWKHMYQFKFDNYNTFSVISLVTVENYYMIYFAKLIKYRMVTVQGKSIFYIVIICYIK